nr:MAG: capsid protein [Cressdnaviricota sp.]
MDIERGRSLTRRRLIPAFVRAASATGRILRSVATSPAAAIAYARLGKRVRVGSPPTPPASMSRSRSRSRGRRMSRSRSTRRRSRSRSTVSGIASRQHDQSSRFRGRRGRGHGRARSFGRRVTGALIRDEPLQIYTVKTSLNLTSSLNAMDVFGVGLYTTQQTDQNDLQQVFIDAALPIATTANLSSRLFFRSACLDVQIKNTGSTEIIMDCYVMYQRKDVATSNDVGTQWTNFFGDLTAISYSGALDVSNSVFENPVFCEYYKVLSKTEVLILPGEIVTRQMRDGKTRFIQAQQVKSFLGAYPKINKFMFFMWHGPPDPTAGTGSTAGIAPTTVTFSYQKAYKYAFPPTPKSIAQIHNE